MHPVKNARGFDGRTRQPIHSFAAAAAAGTLIAAVALGTLVLIMQTGS